MASAHFSGRLARDVVEISDDLSCLDSGGFWVVVVTFEGRVSCIRFAQVSTVQVSTGHVSNGQVSGPPVTNGQKGPGNPG